MSRTNRIDSLAPKPAIQPWLLHCNQLPKLPLYRTGAGRTAYPGVWHVGENGARKNENPAL